MTSYARIASRNSSNSQARPTSISATLVAAARMANLRGRSGSSRTTTPKRAACIAAKRRGIAAIRSLSATAATAAPNPRLFFYLPFAHSEVLDHQARCVARCGELGDEHLAHAKGHRDIIARFGRFPHRNPILGRETIAEEQRFLDTVASRDK